MKEGYKQTEVGIIPKDWEVKPLKQISPSQSVGLVINPSTYYDEAGTVPMLVGSQIHENYIDWESANKISEKSNKLLPASRLSADDLVTVRVGDPGVTAVVPAELDNCNCASMMIIRKHPSYVSHWLCYMMNSRLGRSQVEHVQYGTAQKQFNISDAVNFKFPVPCLREQDLIAEALSDVDGLIEALDRLIAKKRALKTATMQQLLTGKKRLPGFEREWETISFRECCRPRKERIAPQGLDDSISSIELEHIEHGSGKILGSVQANRLASIKTVFYPGDILFGKLRSYLRKFWLADRPGVCSTEIWAFEVDKSQSSPSFLFQIVQSDHFIDTASEAYGTHMPRADWNVVGNFEILLPPLEEQRSIAEVLTNMDSEIAVLEEKHAKLELVKNGMMQELLTGKTRLV